MKPGLLVTNGKVIMNTQQDDKQHWVLERIDEIISDIDICQSAEDLDMPPKLANQFSSELVDMHRYFSKLILADKIYRGYQPGCYHVVYERVNTNSDHELVIVRGLPGSGKSTFAKREYPNYQHIETDMFQYVDGEYRFDPNRIKTTHELCRCWVKIHLLNNTDTVVSNTFTQMWELEPYLAMAEESFASVKVIEATGQFGNIHNVPEEVLTRMKDRYEKFVP